MLQKALTDMKIEWKDHVSLKNYSTFKTGGTADAVVFPKNEEELCCVIKSLQQDHIPYLIVGNGSNILFSDNGFRGVIINLHKYWQRVDFRDDGTVTAQSGISLTALSMAAAKRGFSGLSFAYGIPGLLGGAVFMNAGAYGGEMSQILISCRYMEEDTTVKEYTKEEMKLGYRSSVFQNKSGVLLDATLFLQKGDPSSVIREMDGYMASRMAKQPLEYPSCGSTFKRPEGYFAGKLIEDAGLSGFSVGGAQVSEKHCGFIINRNNASSSDIVSLIKYVKKSVWDRFHVALEPEVRIISETGKIIEV